MGIANVNCHVQSCNLPYTFEDDVIYIIQYFNAYNTKMKTYPWYLRSKDLTIFLYAVTYIFYFASLDL